MIYSDFKGEKLSRLGFGAMRLPVLANGDIDVEQVGAMVDMALKNGVNYFDTAYPYHGGMSERIMGSILSNYPRQNYNLASKFPGHQISKTYDPKAIFEEQLEKCRVDYFDFYLLHNVFETSLAVYEDPRWNIIEYFVEQRRQGRIRHLGFSSHGRLETLRAFLDRHGENMEFCQLQVNFLDWTLQDAKGKCELLKERNLPLWVMEPVRGGKLSSYDEATTASLRSLRPEESSTAWAFRWLQGLPEAKVILSGMSCLEHMRDNLNTFAEYKPLNSDEGELLEQIAKKLASCVPCTACRYCCEGCPMGLDIPMLLQTYNDIRYEASLNLGIQMEALSEDKAPSACIGCGACARICPQHIEIPEVLSDLTERLSKLPKWADVCLQRDEANKRNRLKVL